MKIYLAGPFGEPGSERRNNALRAATILRDKGYEVYCPWEMIIPHAWDYPNAEWGLMVFSIDVQELNKCDLVVMLDYGRKETTAGTNWESGYAYGIGKKIIRVELNDDNIVSLMVANSSYATVKGLDGLATYDFEHLIPLRLTTEQK